MSDIISRAEARQKIAEQILQELDLINRKRQFTKMICLIVLLFRFIELY